MCRNIVHRCVMGIVVGSMIVASGRAEAGSLVGSIDLGGAAVPGFAANSTVLNATQFDLSGQLVVGGINGDYRPNPVIYPDAPIINSVYWDSPVWTTIDHAGNYFTINFVATDPPTDPAGTLEGTFTASVLVSDESHVDVNDYRSLRYTGTFTPSGHLASFAPTPMEWDVEFIAPAGTSGQSTFVSEFFSPESSAVPEPSSYALLTMAAVVLATLDRRRKNAPRAMDPASIR